ncbi:PREDICTED: histone-lysine N-methyltransferase PRDM9-like [Acropora digitifera]|uniref:histone-lysine N-methyltransferase PRDM9-like n=1 Tax=Acropora digitifera TaxID=70779 RepID=UPI00077A9EAC|nr:PREDICTED: histone-lysine N-methyltransferase PRDM9-like [Acropora digitifera]
MATAGDSESRKYKNSGKFSDKNIMDNSLSEYELLRLRNIKTKHEFMKSLGLPVPAIPAGLPCRTRKLTTKKHKTLLTEDQDSEISSECSDDSDDDWVPGSEEARKRKKMNKRFIPDFRPKPQVVPDSQRQRKEDDPEDFNSSAFDELGRLGEQIFLSPSTMTTNQTENQTARPKRAKRKDAQRIQYATRDKKHCYCEAEVPDDDHYIFCEDCHDLYYGDCPKHGPLQVIEDKDAEHSWGVSAAIASTPDVLEIDQSSIPGAGLGVFSAAFIPERARFGPYKGDKVVWENMTDKTDTSYFWEVMKDGKFSHFVDGHDKSNSNWMRFVNCPRSEDEQNLVAFQYRGKIYYRTYKAISPGKELLVWYGEGYARELGIEIDDSQEDSVQSHSNGN